MDLPSHCGIEVSNHGPIILRRSDLTEAECIGLEDLLQGRSSVRRELGSDVKGKRKASDVEIASRIVKRGRRNVQIGPSRKLEFVDIIDLTED